MLAQRGTSASAMVEAMCMPDLLPPEPETARATGTDGADCPLPCPFPGSSGGSWVPAGSELSARGGGREPYGERKNGEDDGT